MKELRQTGQFKRDLKRYQNSKDKLAKLVDVLELLRQEMPIPPSYKPHILTGDYKGCMECHIQGDFLLVWLDEETNTITLLRLGSHSEIFGKGVKR